MATVPVAPAKLKWIEGIIIPALLCKQRKFNRLLINLPSSYEWDGRV